MDSCLLLVFSQFKIDTKICFLSGICKSQRFNSPNALHHTPPANAISNHNTTTNTNKSRHHEWTSHVPSQHEDNSRRRAHGCTKPSPSITTTLKIESLISYDPVNYCTSTSRDTILAELHMTHQKEYNNFTNVNNYIIMI